MSELVTTQLMKMVLVTISQGDGVDQLIGLTTCGHNTLQTEMVGLITRFNLKIS